MAQPDKREQQPVWDPKAAVRKMDDEHAERIQMVANQVAMAIKSEDKEAIYIAAADLLSALRGPLIWRGYRLESYSETELRRKGKNGTS